MNRWRCSPLTTFEAPWRFRLASNAPPLIAALAGSSSIENMAQAIENDPSLALACNARGYAYLRMKQYAKAIADFDSAIDLRPAYVNAYSNRAAAKRAAADKAGSDADFAKGALARIRPRPTLSRDSPH